MICPYCNTPVDDAEAKACPECGATHHGECWQENGGCTVFGCQSAPPDEPKVTVREAEIPLPLVPSSTGYNYVPQASTVPYGRLPKDRVTYVVFGVFFGCFGVHNFYAGYYGRAGAQLAITLMTCLVGGIVSWIWALVEVCIVDEDAEHIPMR